MQLSCSDNDDVIVDDTDSVADSPSDDGKMGDGYRLLASDETLEVAGVPQQNHKQFTSRCGKGARGLLSDEESQDGYTMNAEALSNDDEDSSFGQRPIMVSFANVVN